MENVWGQNGYAVRFEWGATGARQTSSGSAALVVVDVFSFSTALSVALDQGTSVIPAPFGDGRAHKLAEQLDAELAVGRRAITPENPWSLSPAALRRAPAPARLVLPSPNGSTIAAQSTGIVLSACLRNARVVAQWLAEHVLEEGRPLTLIAAGERWPDGSLRPALEDLLGAGAVLSELAQIRSTNESPEARSARVTYEALGSVDQVLQNAASALELIEIGCAEDVEIALEHNTSELVPLLRDGMFQSHG